MGDHYTKKFPETYPWIPVNIPNPNTGPVIIPSNWEVPISRAEFESLKRDVLEMKEILKVAKKYDEDTGQPHCEQEEKIRLLKRIAELVGVEL
jgi:hypothetical protein